MKYIVISEFDNEYEEFDNLEEAREYVIDEIDNGVDADKFKLLKVSDEYEVVSSKKVLFKKLNGGEEE